MQASEQLLPCPFCGGVPNTEFFGPLGSSIWCDNEDCDVTVEYTHHVSESEAIAAWNRRTPLAQPMDAPDGPGHWAFEGSEWKSKPIYLVNGVEYDEWQEEWTDEAEDYWHKHELELYPVHRYKDVRGEPFRMVVEVEWVRKGQSIHERKRTDPHNGEPVLGFLSPRRRWSHVHDGIDTVIGKWTRIYMPWEEQP